MGIGRRACTRKIVAVAWVAAALQAGCGSSSSQEWEWDLPEHFPEPRVPEDNPMSPAKVELGRHLFYDERLSGNETQACASCHAPNLGFTDGLEVSVGSTGEMTPRNSMSLANVAYAATLTWANPNMRRLKEQALVPMFGEEPVELGLAGKREELLDRLRADPQYESMFAEAYPTAADPITLDHVVKAIATFQRTLISADAPYDRYVAGDADAMSESAKRGEELFFSERLECFHCHGGFNFSDAIDHDGNEFDQAAFHNTGLYNVDGRGAYPPQNTGVHDITGEPQDMGKFKAPTLRNIELTAPYMHDGSIATLDEVLDHYARGGRRITEGEYAGDGSENPFKSEFVRGFELSEQERQDLLAFLEALTDRSFFDDPAIQNPFEE